MAQENQIKQNESLLGFLIIPDILNGDAGQSVK